MEKVTNCDKGNYIISYFSKEEMLNNMDKNTELLNISNKDIIIKMTDKKNMLINLDLKIDEMGNTQKEQIIRKIIKIKKICDNKKINFGMLKENKIIVLNICNCPNGIDKNNEIFVALNAILITDIREKYNYIYSKLCDYLDNIFLKNNACEFKDNVCLAKRSVGVTGGCCHYYKNKLLGPLLPLKLIPCRYQKNGTCSIRCLECKLYTCDALLKKGIKFTVNNVILIKVFFNILQRLIIRLSIYTPQDKIINRLLTTKFY